MVILNQVTCPRDTGWGGDQHAAGLITMMCGRRPVPIPGTDVAGDPNAKNQVAADKTFDQAMLEKSAMLQGTAVPSIQSTAYRPGSVGLPCFKVMSYAGNNRPLFPESRPEQLLTRIFGAGMPGVSPEALMRARAQHKSVLDFVNQDLARLQGHVPQSQRPKLDAHLDGIRQLEKALDAPVTPGVTCAKPNQVTQPNPPSGVTIDEAQHLTVTQNQLAIIKTAFQCDLTRVATFTFAHGNSDLRFVNVSPGISANAGHHNVSHDTNASAQQAGIEQYYSARMADFLQTLKATPDGDGTLLDSTLIVYLNECCIGNTHSIENMPVLMFGGKTLNLQTGRHLRFGNRYMNDVWAAIAGALGAQLPMNRFGDPAWGTGPVTGLFG
jgi:hypothetical protein